MQSLRSGGAPFHEDQHRQTERQKYSLLKWYRKHKLWAPWPVAMKESRALCGFKFMLSNHERAAHAKTNNSAGMEVGEAASLLTKTCAGKSTNKNIPMGLRDITHFDFANLVCCGGAVPSLVLQRMHAATLPVLKNRWTNVELSK